jgi:sugar porter (SP) family MFS transporter
MSLLDKIRSSSVTGRLVYLLLTATLGPFLFGYHLAELNAPQDVITCKRDSIKAHIAPGLPQCIPMTPLEIGLVSSIYTLGGLIGALSSGGLSAKYGRLPPMRVGSVVALIGGCLTAVAPSISVMSLGRFISGLAAGSATVVVPLFISEVAPPGQKGMFGALTQIMTCSGIVVTQLLGFFLSHGQMWRIILAAAGAVGGLQFLGLLFAAESPKWLADHGYGRQARITLQQIRGEGADISEETASWNSEAAEPEEQGLLTQTRSHSSGKEVATMGIFEVLRNPKTLPATFAVIMVMTAQQLCGINSIVMYGVSLLATLLSSSSALLNICVSVLNLIVTVSCSPLPDKLGRKVCILGSIAGMGLSSILLGIGIRASLSVLSAIATLSFVASFSTGLGPVPFILSSELVDPEAVGAVQSWALASNWIATFIVAQFFPIVNEKLGKGITYFIFAGFAAFFFAFIAWWVPETKGKKTAAEAWGWEDRRED